MTSTLLLGDCLERMAELPNHSVDLIFTSPPYNLGTSSGGGLKSARRGMWGNASLAHGYEHFDDAMPIENYILWQKQVLSECWRLLTEDGAIYYNHKPRIQNGVLWTPLELNPDLPIRQIVIWKRAGGINFSPTFYLPSYEWIIIFAKPGFRLRDKTASGAKDLWDIPQESNNPHPAPFPVSLPRIALQTTNAMTVLDPFMGSGSVGVACAELNRNFIGIEIDEGYVNQARKRIAEAESTAVLFSHPI